MSKNIFKWLMRAWMTLASVGALVAGWVAFSHSEKPGDTASAGATTSSEGEFAPLPTLAPLQSSNSLRSLPRQTFQQPSFQQGFRTRGS